MARRILAWHFTDGRLRDGRPLPAVGYWLVHPGPVRICCSGLHASFSAYDALRYAGYQWLLHRVEVRDIVTRRADKFVCQQRKILGTIASRPVRRRFEREARRFLRWATGARATSEWRGASVHCLFDYFCGRLTHRQRSKVRQQLRKRFEQLCREAMRKLP